MEDREAVVDRIHVAKAAREAAELAYEHALTRAKQYGLNNSEIARACGVSEAAIRMYLKRHNIQSKQAY